MLNATPYEQTWTFGFQRELGGGFVVDATYLGKQGTKLYFGGRAMRTTWAPKIEHYTPAQLADLATLVPNPFYGISSGHRAAGHPHDPESSAPAAVPAVRSLLHGAVPVANSSFNAFQLKVEKRFSHGFQVLGHVLLVEVHGRRLGGRADLDGRHRVPACRIRTTGGRSARSRPLTFRTWWD